LWEEKSDPGIEWEASMESSRPHMSHKMLFCKAGIDFVVRSFFPPPKNQFHDGIDSHKELMLGVLTSLKVQLQRDNQLLID
jgi:hypothetical protein